MHQILLNEKFIRSQLDVYARIYVDIDNVCWATARTAMKQFGIKEWPADTYDLGVQWAMLRWHEVPVVFEPPDHPRVFIVTSVPTCMAELNAKMEWVGKRSLIFTHSRHRLGTSEDLLIDDYIENIAKWPGETIHIEWRGPIG